MSVTVGMRGKLTLVFVAFATLLLGAAGLLAYRSGLAALREATESALLATAVEKEAALRGWVEDRQLELHTLAASPALAGAFADFLSVSPGAARAPAARERVVAELRPRIGAAGFLQLFVMDPASGRVVLATNPGEEGMYREDQPYFREGRTARRSGSWPDT